MSDGQPAEAGPGIRAEDAVQFAHRVLRGEILDGRLPGGAVLSQVRLALELGISRTPLREALRRLVSEGLVVGDFNQRMRVSALDLEDLDQIYAMRIALEPVGVASTVPLLDDAGRAALTSHVAAMDAAIAGGDGAAFRRRHRAFHLGLTADAGPRVNGVLAELWDHSERYRLSYLHRDHPDAAGDHRLRVSQDEHRALLAAAVAGDGVRCGDALVAHLRRTLETVFAEAAVTPRARLTHEALDRRKPDLRGPDLRNPDRRNPDLRKPDLRTAAPRRARGARAARGRPPG